MRWARRWCATAAGSSFRPCMAAVLSIAVVNLITPALQIRSTYPDRRARKCLPAAEWRAQTRSAAAPLDAEAVTSQVQLLLSRDLARDIIKKNRLAELPEFDPVLRGLSPAEIAAGPVRDRPRPVLADAGRARAGCLFRPLHRLRGRQIARHRRRIPVQRSGTRRKGRQFDRRRLSGAAARRAAGAGQIRRAVAVGRNRQSAQEGRGRGFTGRGFPLEIQPVRRHQQHHAVEPADGRAEHATEQRPRAEIRRRVQGAADPRDAAERPADRGFRGAEFRTDPPAGGTARHAAGAAGRAVVDAARRPSAHQGIEGATGRSRPPAPRGSQQALALVRQ